MRKGGVAEGGRNLPPPFHGPQQLETIYYHHGYPIVSISFMTNDIICIYIFVSIMTHIHIYFLISKKNGVCHFLMIGLVTFICEFENIFDLNIKIELVLFRKTAIYFFLSSDSYYDMGNCCC